MTAETLKPCPFCGSTSIEKTEKYVNGSLSLSFIQCSECLAAVSYSNDACMSSAIEIWNTRA